MECPKISTDFMCKMVKLPFFSSFEFTIPSTFSIKISFHQYGNLTEPELADGPISFSCNFDYVRRNSAFKKQFREVDELVVEIKRMEDTEILKQYLVVRLV